MFVGNFTPVGYLCPDQTGNSRLKKITFLMNS